MAERFQTVGGSRVALAPVPHGRRIWQDCPRCGWRRQVNAVRMGELCRDCKSVDPKFGRRAS